MPGPVRWFAEHQPVTPIVDTIRDLFAQQPVGPDIWTALAWCVGLLLVAAYVLANGHLPPQGSPERLARARREGHLSAPPFPRATHRGRDRRLPMGRRRRRRQSRHRPSPLQTRLTDALPAAIHAPFYAASAVADRGSRSTPRPSPMVSDPNAPVCP
jgi:hypothetical protein